MSTITIFGLHKRAQVKPPAPNEPVFTLLKQFCEKYNMNPEEHTLLYNNKPIDLSVPWRLSNLPRGAKLEIALKNRTSQLGGPTTPAPVAKIRVAVQLPNGTRYQQSFAPKTSLWEILKHCESELGTNVTEVKNEATGFYMQPVLNFMNRDYTTLDELQSTTLASLGLSGGSSALLRFILRETQTKFEDVVERLKSMRVEIPETNKTTTTAAAAAAQTRPEEQQQQSMDVDNEETAIQGKDKQVVSQGPTLVDFQQEAATNQEQQQRQAPTVPHPSKVAQDVKVLRPTDRDYTREIEITDDFFQLTREDYHAIMASAARKRESADMLKTRAMREAERLQMARHYTKTIIRVRFPSQVMLQGTFAPSSKFGDVREFIKQSIADPTVPFYTYLAPPIQRIDQDDATLAELKLVPAAVINVAVDKKNLTPQQAALADQQHQQLLRLKPEFEEYVCEAHLEQLPAATLADGRPAPTHQGLLTPASAAAQPAAPTRINYRSAASSSGAGAADSEEKQKLSKFIRLGTTKK